jgi:hypothetical protein
LGCLNHGPNSCSFHNIHILLVLMVQYYYWPSMSRDTRVICLLLSVFVDLPFYTACNFYDYKLPIHPYQSCLVIIHVQLQLIETRRMLYVFT